MSIENFKDPFKVMKGVFQAWRIIGKCQPSIIFSKGGFVSVPVVLAAKLRGIPTIIHESDFTPGLANKIAIRFAQKVFTTFPETEQFLPAKKVEYVGAVIREELFQGDREKGYALTGLKKDKPEIGRASCRERRWVVVGGGFWKKKKKEEITLKVNCRVRIAMMKWTGI